jgi:hypothetical protein
MYSESVLAPEEASDGGAAQQRLLVLLRHAHGLALHARGHGSVARASVCSGGVSAKDRYSAQKCSQQEWGHAGVTIGVASLCHLFRGELARACGASGADTNGYHPDVFQCVYTVVAVAAAAVVVVVVVAFPLCHYATCCLCGE